MTEAEGNEYIWGTPDDTGCLPLYSLRGDDGQLTLDSLYQAVRKKLLKLFSDLPARHQGRFQEMLVRKLGSFLFSAQSFYVEENYNETAWKDMIGHFYMHSFSVVCDKVMRVHLFSLPAQRYPLNAEVKYAYKEQRENLNKHYLGLFNLRPIVNPEYMLSYVMPNYRSYTPKDRNGKLVERLKMLIFARKVHFLGIEFTIYTFSCFFRDNIVTACAHAVMLMTAQYFCHRLKMPNLSLEDIVNNKSSERLDVFPTLGITLPQMLKIYSANNVPVRHFAGKIDILPQDEPKNSHYSYITLGELVFAYIDSQLPVLLAIGEHVVAVVGSSEYKDFDRDKDRELVIYDDSAVLLKAITGKDSFISSVTWQEIVAYSMDLQENEINILVPYFPRATKSYQSLMQNIIRELWNKIKDQPDSQLEFRRVFLVDCTMLKAFLRKKVLKNAYLLENSLSPGTFRQFSDPFLSTMLIEHILAEDTSHYFWCLEIPLYNAQTNNPVWYEYYFFDSNKPFTENLDQYCINFIDQENSAIFKKFVEAFEKHGRQDVNLKAMYPDRFFNLPFFSHEKLDPYMTWDILYPEEER